MLNHKTIFKQKSKILLTIICIFGLAFSYSCSCRSPEAPKGDPTVFSISTNSVETRLVQKADGSGFNYQPSIKFSEANGNQFTVSYEVTDEAGTFKTENTTYDTATGNITFTDLSSLTTSKKSIKITFTVKANDTTLQNPETNFTLNVDLKKTLGALTAKQVVGKLFKDIYVLTYENIGFKFEAEAEATQIVADADFGAGTSGEKKLSQKNFDKALQQKIQETAEKNNNKFYKSMVLTGNYAAGDKQHSFNYKFTFSDEDYDLTDDQKANGIEYIVNIKGTDTAYITWIDKTE